MSENITSGQELKPQGELVFALDIGTRTVVGIIGEYEDEKLRLKDYISVPHTKRAMVDGQVEDIKQVAKIVSIVKAQLEERNGVKLERVSIAAAGRALKTCQVKMDFDVSEKDYLTEDMVKSMEVETIQKAQAELDEKNPGKTAFYCVGHSIISYRLDDYKIISLEGHKGGTAQIELVAAFLPGIVVEGLYAVMDLNALEVTSLTLEPIAAMNVIVPPEIRLINIALVDIGAGTSDIAIAKDGAVCAYAMATTAGDEITEEIIRTYLVDFNTAENLKQSCSGGESEIEYRDILGIPHKVKSADILKMVTPAVDALAETVCSAIISANGGSPAAVFLVGGGSLIEGLPAAVAQKLQLDEARVAIGGGDFLKNVDEGGAKLGAEYVTPLGIAVTSVLNQGYDFSVVTVNDSKVRVFDTKQLSVYEALTGAGYKSAEIMGRSGRALSFTLNGSRRTIKGGAMTPAEVFVNDKPASIMTKVSQGDRIRFVPAVSGTNAAAKLSDLLNYGRFAEGFVSFGGEKHPIGLKAFVNGAEKPADYEIQPFDEIETTGNVTLGDLMRNLDAELDGIEYIVNGKEESEDYQLSDGDVISVCDSFGNILGAEASPAAAENSPAEEAEEAPVTAEEIPAAAEAIPAAAEEIPAVEEEAFTFTDEESEYMSLFAGMSFEEERTEKAEEADTAQKSEEIPAEKPSANAIPFDRTEKSGITLTLNGKSVSLPYSESGNILLDLLNYISIDPTVPGSEIVLEINGESANFSSPIYSGDMAVIKVQERKLAK